MSWRDTRRFRDLGHGELGSLVGLHASGARFEQYGADSVLVAQRWCESPNIAARLILMMGMDSQSLRSRDPQSSPISSPTSQCC